MPRYNNENMINNFPVIFGSNLSASQNFQNNIQIDGYGYPSKTITIIIKNPKLSDIRLQVNSDNLNKEVIAKYQNKLQNDKIKNIDFKKEDGKLFLPDKKLEEVGIKNNSIILADIDDGSENFYGIPKEQLDNLKATMKEKYKQGIITLQIQNSQLGTDYFYVDKSVKFRVVAEQFKTKYPGKKWFFVFNGLSIDEQSQEKTLKELHMKMLSKILAEEYEGD